MDDLTVVQVENSWVFSDGTTLPVISGGSDPGPAEEPYDWTQDPELSDYAKEFLPSLPEEHRPIVAPHVKNWDSGYNKQVERLRSQHQQELQRYSALGSPDSLAQHVQVSQAFQADPYGTIKRLVDANYLDKSQLADLMGVAQQMEQQPPTTPEFTQHPEWQKTQQGLQAVANWIMQQDQQRQQQTQQQALDTSLEQIKQKAPGIDETYALSIAYAMMREGQPVDADKIASQWKSMQQSILSQYRAPNAARTMPGAGAPNTATKKPADMSPEERVQYLTQALQNMNP